MNPIRTASMPNNTPEVPCRIQLRDHAGKLLAIQTYVPGKFRKKFALEIIRFIHPTCKTATQIRSASLILDLEDGTVETGPVHTMPRGDGGAQLLLGPQVVMLRWGRRSVREIFGPDTNI